MSNLQHSRVEELMSMGPSVLQVYAGKAAGATVNLSVGQPEMSPPSAVVTAVKQFVDDSRHARYTSAAGSDELLVVVAEVFNDLGFSKVDQQNVAVSNGAKSLVSSIMKTLGGPRAPVFWFEPGYTYGRMARINGLDPVVIRISNDHFGVEDGIRMLDEYHRSLGDTPGILVINTPTNPTGMVWKKSWLEALAVVTEKHNLLVIADETYADLTYLGYEHTSFALLPNMFERTITVRSASKELRMAGYRLGYAVGPKDLMVVLKMVLGDCEGCPNTIAQAALKEVLGQHGQSAKEQLPSLKKNRQLVIDWCLKNQLKHYSIGGAFYAFIDLGLYIDRHGWKDSIELADQLLKHKPSVGVIPGQAFSECSSFDKWIRISFAGPEDELVRGLKIIEQMIAIK